MGWDGMGWDGMGSEWIVQRDSVRLLVGCALRMKAGILGGQLPHRFRMHMFLPSSQRQAYAAANERCVPPIAHKLAFALPSTSTRPRSAGEVRLTNGMVSVL